jgi:DNA-binding CsgD family transcriptional regulator
MRESYERVELLERGTELAQLDAAIAATERGAGSAVLIEGPAGIGKTRLLAEGMSRAKGMTVLAARGDDLEREFAWGVVRQLFDRTLTEADGTTLLEGAASLAAAPLGLGSGDGHGEASFAALHGLYWLTANLSQRAPLVVALDDLHWADAPSLRYVIYLVRRLAGMPVAVLAAARVGEAALETGGLLERLGAEDSVTVLRPAALSEDATASLVPARVGAGASQELCDACHEITGGNPFLLLELLRELASSGRPLEDDAAARVRRLTPEVVRRRVLLRLARLPAAALGIARAVAVLGAGASVARVATVASCSQDAVVEAARALTAAEILVGDSATLRFVHAIVREAVYQDLSEHERGRWHARAARALAGEHAPLEEVAGQLLVSAPSGDSWVVSTLCDAAALASQRAAADVAVTYLRRALLEPPPADLRSEVLFQLGVAEIVDNPTSASTHLGEAVELASDDQRRAHISLALGRATALCGRFSDAAAVLESAITQASQGSSLEATLVAEFLDAARWDLSTRSRTFSVLARLQERASRGAELDPRLHAQLAIETAAACGDPGVALAHARQALEHDEVLFTPEASPTVPQVISVLLFAGRREEAEHAAGHWLRTAQARGWPLVAALAAQLCGLVAIHAGNVSDAIAYVRQSLSGPEEVWIPPLGVGFLLEPLAARGEVAAAYEELRARGLDGELPPTWPFVVLRFFRGRLHAAAGDHDRAVGELLQTGELCEAYGLRNPTFVWWRSSAAESLTALGQRAEAQRLANEELTLAESMGSTRAVGVALRALGNAQREGLVTLREAVSTLEESAAALELARAHVDLGAALRRAGRRADARQELRRGLDLAHRLGALALAGRAREELVVAGARPRRDALRGRDALTASELRVAQMASEGLTNREIAEALFVTLRTVEHHLTSAYSKLGIASRRQLGPSLDAPSAHRLET